MLALNSLKSHCHYFLEGILSHCVAIKIDRFDLNKEESTILVIYRLGRQKLAQKMMIGEFSTKYFGNLSGYDRQRITKFSTLQDLLVDLFCEDSPSRRSLINYIKMGVKHDQLF